MKHNLFRLEHDSAGGLCIIERKYGRIVANLDSFDEVVEWLDAAECSDYLITGLISPSLAEVS